MLININKSKLVEKVYKESKPKKHNTPHNFYAILESFAKHVAPQLTQTNLLFDEYTPHDNIHMESLFRIADELLGENIINNLNGCEACILACAIYGHDWGMAVSQDEKELIVTGKTPAGGQGEKFALLDDENYRWKKYAQSKRLDIDDGGYIVLRSEGETIDEKVSKKIWREYVRQTHAERSKARAEHFFTEENEIFGKLLGEVCAGHWYTIAKIQQLSKNRLAFGVQNNLRALATYMRFIDLLDIGQNRTPYSLWKFVNPKNLFSAKEWKKHRALQPVYFLKNNGTLIIQVQGTTKDHRVYASLKDMENWVSTQVKENEQTLIELGNYSLGEIKLEWEVEPDGFEPIDIRFEFDRSKMFDLISGEIYNGDPYVFLRELIQNSIDATKVRELLYKEQHKSIDFEELRIEVEVIHQDNGDSQIKFSDSGTGMSLNIVRNYLSVIGKSYYRSDEFNELDLEMNPISRFGVGLISCFEIADAISIETRTDPSLVEESEALRIEIENYNQQFKVKRLLKDSIPIGTSITVQVLGDKWKKNDFKDEVNLKVTEYLKAISGFVPYPVLISENGNQTLILSADISSEIIDQLKSEFENATVWQEPLSLSLNEVIEHSDLGNAQNIYEEKYIYFSKDIVGYNISGGLSCFLPKDTLIGARRGSAFSPSYSATIGVLFDSKFNLIPIHWKPSGPNAKVEGICESAKKSDFKRLYLNGILVPNIEDNLLDFDGKYSPPSRITLNITTSKEKTLTPTLSRKEIRDSKKILNEILEPIFKEEFQRLYMDFENQLIKSDLYHRLFLLARIKSHIPRASSYLKDYFAIDSWPVPYFNQIGKIELEEVKNLPTSIEVLPKKFMQDRMDVNQSWLMEKYLQNINYPDVSQFLSTNSERGYIKDFGFDYDDGSAMEWNEISDFLTRTLLSWNYKLIGLRIPEFNGQKYIIEKWEKGAETQTEKENRYIDTFEFLSIYQLNNVFALLPLENSQLFKNTARKVIFNTNHPATVILKNALIAYNENLSTLSDSLRSKLKRVFQSRVLPGHFYDNYSGTHLQRQISSWTRLFCIAVKQSGLISLNSEEREILYQPLEIYICFE